MDKSKITKDYFNAYCIKLDFFINNLEKYDKDINFLDISKPSLKRYKVLNDYLLDNNYLDNKSNILDVWSYIWLYIKYLEHLWIEKVVWIEKNLKTVMFGRKIGVKNLFEGDILDINLPRKYNNFDVVSCLRVFEKTYIELYNWNFIMDASINIYNMLKKWWIYIFSIADWYMEYDEVKKEYYRVSFVNNFDVNNLFDIWFSKLKYLWDSVYIFEK